MFTTHGHQIPGTDYSPYNHLSAPPECPDLYSCPKCYGEAYHRTLVYDQLYTIRRTGFMDVEARVDQQTKAKIIVANYFNDRITNPEEVPDLTLRDIYIVWFAKTLKNWKALVTTSVPDDTYYELTYNGAENCIYVDVYKKQDNIVIADGKQR